MKETSAVLHWSSRLKSSRNDTSSEQGAQTDLKYRTYDGRFSLGLSVRF